jgi:hypothetical protein
MYKIMQVQYLVSQLLRLNTNNDKAGKGQTLFYTEDEIQRGEEGTPQTLLKFHIFKESNYAKIDVQQRN